MGLNLYFGRQSANTALSSVFSPKFRSINLENLQTEGLVSHLALPFSSRRSHSLSPLQPDTKGEE